MKPIVQEDRTGCGLASVATVAGVSYKQAKKVAGQLGIDVQDPQLWSDTKYVRTLLTHYGLSTSPHTTPFTSWETLPSLALLAIKWHKRNNCAFWHWVIFWRGSEGPVVLDPKQSLKKNIRTDFGRMKPKWFIALGSKRSL
jgi:ABC-type bacteriocin/lantibiotic exporter with double-glycine peptidase domain